MSNQLIATAWGPIDISTGANAIYTHTATKTGNLFFQIFLDSVAGGTNDYVAWVTIQRLGSGTAYPVIPLSTGSGYAGWTALAMMTIAVQVTATDVVKVYVDGQAADNAISGYIRIYEDDYLRPVAAAQYGVDVTSGGAVGVDWSNVENPGSTVGLSATTVKTATDVETDTADIQSRLPAALAGGRIDASVGAMQNDVITANAHDETTAFPVKQADAGATAIARTGADGDTLESLSDQIDAVPTAGAIADAVLDEALAAHDTEDSVGNVLNDLVEESSGTYRFTSAALQSTLGAGSLTFSYTLTDEDSGLPIADANVWVTTDEAGTNVIASGQTNSSGIVTFYLDAGTYYVWRQKDGWNFDNPDTEVVA